MLAITFSALLLSTAYQGRLVGGELGVCAHYGDITPSATAEMRQDGFRWIRTDLPWAEVERHKGQYDFSRYDTLARTMHDAGIRPLFILDYGNPIYTGDESPRTPDQILAFALYARAAAEHFQQYDPIWEIWNEPNHKAYWKPAPNATEYGRLATDTARAIKSVVPNAKIAALGLTTLDWDFMRTAAKTGLMNFIDYLSVHMYRFVRPETALADYEQAKKFIADCHLQNRVGVLCTEWGYPLTYPGQNEERQGAYIARVYLTGLMAGIDGTFLYEWSETPMAPGQTQGHFGLHNAQGAPRPGLQYLGYLENELRGYQYVGAERSSGDSEVLEFRRGNTVKTVAWSVQNDPRDMRSVSAPPSYTPVQANVGGRQLMLSPVPRVVSTERR